VSFLTGTLAAKQVEFLHAMVPNATPRQPSAQLHTAGKQTIAGMVVRGWIENQISDEAQELVNGPHGAHIQGMEKYRSRMLEVTVTNYPPRWEWEVSSNGEMIANGLSASK
jgi:hypothetical protein